MKEMKKQDVAVFIKEKLRNKQPLIIAIDGRSASGKTTLAKELNQLFLSEVIHMDDFFSSTGAEDRRTSFGSGRQC